MLEEEEQQRLEQIYIAKKQQLYELDPPKADTARDKTDITNNPKVEVQQLKQRPSTSTRGAFTNLTKINRATWKWTNELHNNQKPFYNRNSHTTKSPRQLIDQMYNESNVSSPIKSPMKPAGYKSSQKSKSGEKRYAAVTDADIHFITMHNVSSKNLQIEPLAHQ
jgi:hypothetical protein